MTPEELIRPLLPLPDDLVRLLFLLLLREPEDIRRPRAEMVGHILSRIQLADDGLQVSLGELAGMASSVVPFWRDLLKYQVCFRIPEKIRPQHTHIIGVPGTGKSELIKQLVYQDMQTDASVIVMAPKGNLISDIARIPKESIHISDWSNVGLNLLDLEPHLIIYVFESLLESAPTAKQKAFLTQALKQIKNLSDFRRLVATTKGNYAETAEQIAWRLDLFPPIVEQVLSRETTLDIPSIMREGRVLLLDTAQLKEGSSFIGRFIIALIANAIPKHPKHPVYVYIDECSLYLTDYIEEMLDRAREARVCLTLAHQRLSQLSTQTEQALLSAATRFVGRVVPDDARKLAPLLRLEPDALTHQKDLTFALYSQGFLPHTLHIQITPGFLDQFQKNTPAHYAPSRSMLSPSPQKEDREDEDAW